MGNTRPTCLVAVERWPDLAPPLELGVLGGTQVPKRGCTVDTCGMSCELHALFPCRRSYFCVALPYCLPWT